MPLYEHDAFFSSMRRGPEYTSSYEGFMVGADYMRGIHTFSSRHVYRGCMWPTKAVRELWAAIRGTQVMTVP